MAAPTVVRMATCDGAQALGMGDIAGSLKAGKKADIIMIDIRQTPSDPHVQ